MTQGEVDALCIGLIVGAFGACVILLILVGSHP